MFLCYYVKQKSTEKKMMVLFFLLCVTSLINARPIKVDLMELLRESEKILKIEVISIENRILKYKNLKTQQVDTAFTYGAEESFESPVNGYLSGTLPKLGDTVIIVVTKSNEICLYAKKIEGDYRFWSPFAANSSTLFFYTRPVKGLSNNTESKATDYKPDDAQEYFQCFDGCILESKYFELKNGCFRKKGFEKFIKRNPKHP